MALSPILELLIGYITSFLRHGSPPQTESLVLLAMDLDNFVSRIARRASNL
jgi:hypothetical protein